MGAGDEIMATGDVKRLYAETGQRVVIFDRKDRPRFHDLFRGNPKIVAPHELGASLEGFNVVLSGAGRRPYANYEAIEAHGRRRNPQAKNTKELRRAASRLFFTKDYKVTGGEIYLDDNEKKFGANATKGLGDFVIIEPNIKGRVPAKQWGVNNWQFLADAMIRRGLQPIQIGPGTGTKLTGVRYIKTPTFRTAMAVMEHANRFVVPEGGLHHAFSAFNKPGVALFAGRTPLNLSYPEQLTWYIQHKGGACGAEHVDCAACRMLWQDLTVTDVMNLLTRC